MLKQVYEERRLIPMKVFAITPTPVFADGIDLPLVLFYGGLILVPLMGFQVAVESWVLARVWRIPFKTLLPGVLSANCWSFIAGIPSKLLNSCLYAYVLPSDLIGYFSIYPFAVFVGTLIYFVITVLVEGLCMSRWLKSSKLVIPKLWWGVLIANLSTYAVLGPLHYFATRPLQNIKAYTTDTRWAEKPATQVIYIDSDSGQLKCILLDGSQPQTLVPFQITNYSLTSNLQSILFQDERGTSQVYRVSTGKVTPANGRAIQPADQPTFGVSNDHGREDSDSFEQWRAWTEHG